MIQLDLKTTEKGSISELLEKLYPEVSKNKLKLFFTGHRIMRNSFLAPKDSNLKIGESISILKKPKFLGKIKVYYVDNEIVVLEKPAYLLSVDSDNNPGNSVHSSLKRQLGAVFPVQRLDKETTGVMVFALSRKSKEHLSLQFEQKSVEREYIAIAQGSIETKEGIWKSYLQEGGDKKMKVANSGKLAITHYSVLRTLKDRYTLLRCTLETGRKNQIRIHAAHAGHPLLGDSRYGDCKKNGTLYLHAHKLAFIHPVTGKKMSFISPTPNEFHKKIK